MVVHVVLFRPKEGLEEPAERALLDALTRAASGIPSVRRFLVGRTLENAPTYVLSGFPPFPYCGLVEFDSREGLLDYLQHPLHVDLGRLFNETLDAALIYDFDVQEASGAATALASG